MHNVEISKSAAKELAAIKRGDPKLHRQIVDAIKALETDPRPDGCTDLKGRAGYRIRVREFRVIYTVNDGELLVLVIKVGKRGQVYD